MKLTVFCLVFVCSILFSVTSYAVSLDISYWEDDAQNLQINEVSEQSFSKAQPQFSLNALKQVVWVRVIITNVSNKQQEQSLHYEIPYMSREIDIYDSGGSTYSHTNFNLMDKSIGEKLMGSSLVYDVNLKASEVRTIYLRNEALFAQVFKFSLRTKADSYKYLINKSFAGNYIVAILLGLAFYNLTLFFFGEKKDYLFYSLYLINAAIGLFYMYGAIYHHFNIYGSNIQWFNLSAILVPFFLSFFVKYAFRTNENGAFADKVLNFVIVLAAIDVVIAIVYDLSFAMKLMPIVFIASFLSLLGISYVLVVEGHPLIKVFMLAYAIYIFGMALTMLSIYGFIPFNDVFFYASGLGLIVEAFIFSFLLKLRNERLYGDT